MSLFRTETLKPIILETEFDDLATADMTRILYQKPGGTEGYWQASVQGKNLIYEPDEGDIDILGWWSFQAYVEFGTGVDKRVGYGTIAKYEVKKPITNF